MPVAVAVVIRVIVQAIVQTGVYVFVSALIAPLLDTAKNAVKRAFNMTDEEAEDSIANELIDALAMVGIIGLTIKTKLPTIVAEKLGFTSRGYVKRKLSAKLPASVAGTGAKASTIKTLAQPEAVAQMTAIATKRGVSFDTVSKVASVIVAGVGVPVGLGLLITNTIDFGAWNSSAYQQTFQKFLSIFGLEPDKDSRSPRTTSADIFNKIFSALQGQGATTINDPYKDTIVSFNRDNLLDLSDKLAGQILIENGEVKSKTLLASILPFISFQNKPTTTATPATSGGAVVTVQQPKIQVFSGIVSQGVLGGGTTFQARTNDMIDDMQELIESASINLAGFLTALPSRVTYEVKIVSSITTKDGFTQHGTTTRVISSYNRDGTPRYKNITNKFAVLYLYLLTDKGTRTKIASVNVGPVNSVNFQVASTDLNVIAKTLQSVATTSDVSKITAITSLNIVSSLPPKIVAPVVIPPQIPIVAPAPVVSAPQVTGQHFIIGRYGSSEIWDDATLNNIRSNPNYGSFQEVSYDVWKANTDKSVNTGSATQTAFIAQAETKTAPPPIPTTTAPPAQRNGANANTLSEWYTANGQSLPTVSARSVLYQNYGLGSSALYIGSAEQNTRLLDKLKGF